MARSTSLLPSSYYDSVVLMRVASQLKKREGVSEVAMFMGTEGNHELLAQVGLTTDESRNAGPQDLIIIVDAFSETLSRDISAEAVTMLSARTASGDGDLEYRPRTLDTALSLLSDASLAAISIPGEYAAREARKCLERGLNVFLFSDNVPIEEELRLKSLARANNLLCMGPDCGTSYLNGVGLGFANIINPGRIGCIAASGTGLQAVVCELDRLGEGVSHGIGVGGRDLSREIGGIMTSYCLKLLDADENTEVIVLLSKPPHDSVIATLETTCSQISTPVIACFQGMLPATTAFLTAATLDEAAGRAASLLRGRPFSPHTFDDRGQVAGSIERLCPRTEGRKVLGLFTGGTLAKEASLILADALGHIDSSLTPERGHAIVDLGDDRYTVGRPHPMIAPESRTEALLDLAEGGRLGDCGVLLVDLVLGRGSYHDPAGELLDAVEHLRAGYHLEPVIVAAVIGSDADPQDLESQMDKLTQSGISVFRRNSEAARYAAMLVEPSCRKRYMES